MHCQLRAVSLAGLYNTVSALYTQVSHPAGIVMLPDKGCCGGVTPASDVGSLQQLYAAGLHIANDSCVQICQQ